MGKCGLWKPACSQVRKAPINEKGYMGIEEPSFAEVIKFFPTF